MSQMRKFLVPMLAVVAPLFAATACNATTATGVLQLGPAGGSCLKVEVGGKEFALSTFYAPQVARGMWITALVGQTVKVSSPYEVGSSQETDTVPCGITMGVPIPNAFQILPPGYF